MNDIIDYTLQKCQNKCDIFQKFCPFNDLFSHLWVYKWTPEDFTGTVFIFCQEKFSTKLNKFFKAQVSIFVDIYCCKALNCILQTENKIKDSV
jgi:hypothetical protein